jgi:hypothetical protein
VCDAMAHVEETLVLTCVPNIENIMHMSLLSTLFTLSFSHFAAVLLLLAGVLVSFRHGSVICLIHDPPFIDVWVANSIGNVEQTWLMGNLLNTGAYTLLDTYMNNPWFLMVFFRLYLGVRVLLAQST